MCGNGINMEYPRVVNAGHRSCVSHFPFAEGISTLFVAFVAFGAGVFVNVSVSSFFPLLVLMARGSSFREETNFPF